MPSVFNVIEVTSNSGNVNDVGSLPWAYAKATNTSDPDYENQARLVIDSAVDEIFLTDELVGDSVPLTRLEIITENNEQVEINGNTNPFGSEFRFIDHIGNNGIQFLLQNLTFNSFGADQIVIGGFVVDDGDGGTIRSNALLILNDCVFNESEAGGDGGAIKSFERIDMTNCEFINCVADGSGGAIFSQPIHTSHGITIHNSLFDQNTASEGNGGAIAFYTSLGLLQITGDETLFTRNRATSGFGGAIYQYAGYIDAKSSHSVSVGTGFVDNLDSNNLGSGQAGNALFLEELKGADIDIYIDEAPNAVYLYNIVTQPPVPTMSNPEISRLHVSRIIGGIISNWDDTYWF